MTFYVTLMFSLSCTSLSDDSGNKSPFTEVEQGHLNHMAEEITSPIEEDNSNASKTAINFLSQSSKSFVIATT